MNDEEETFFSSQQDQQDEFDLREYLLDLAEKKEIDATPNSIKKASEKSLRKIYEKHKQKQMRDTNEMICDMIIGKTSDILETIGWIKSSSETAKKLQGKKLFMRDFSRLMSHVTPYIPFLGFVEGGLSVAEDVGTHAACFSRKALKNKVPKNLKKKHSAMRVKISVKISVKILIFKFSVEIKISR